MLAWKLCSAVAATAMMAATSVWAEEEGAATVVVVDSAQAAPIEARAVWNMKSDYWLGVVVSPTPPALQAQLQLSKEQGLVVETLLPEGPAAKAGVEQYDILLKGNDKPLTGLHDLLQLTNEVKEGKLKLELLRAGKHESVTVTPAKRPEDAMGEMHRIGDIGPNVLGMVPMHFRVIGPGQILPPGGPTAAAPGAATASLNLMVHIKTKLADGSNVEIIRKGPEPAKVTVTHDKEKWEGTSSDLSKIPEKIRPEIQRLLQPALFDRNAFFTAQGAADGVGGLGNGTIVAAGGPNAFLAAPGSPSLFANSPDVEKRLSEMQKQIDELRHQVDAFKAKEKKAATKPE